MQSTKTEAGDALGATLSGKLWSLGNLQVSSPQSHCAPDTVHTEALTRGNKQLRLMSVVKMFGVYK